MTQDAQRVDMSKKIRDTSSLTVHHSDLWAQLSQKDDHLARLLGAGGSEILETWPLIEAFHVLGYQQPACLSKPWPCMNAHRMYCIYQLSPTVNYDT